MKYFFHDSNKHFIKTKEALVEEKKHFLVRIKNARAALKEKKEEIPENKNERKLEPEQENKPRDVAEKRLKKESGDKLKFSD